MANYAKLDINNLVIDVNTIDNDHETQLGEEGIVSWLNENFNNEGIAGGVTWKKTSYNTYGGKYYVEGVLGPDQSKAFRKNFASRGFTYDSSRDAFIEPKSPKYPSWILNEETCPYEPPVAYPDDGKYYKWNESTGTWYETDEFGQSL